MPFSRQLACPFVVAVISAAQAGTIFVDDDNCMGRYPAGFGPSSVAIGDLDGISGPDLAVANDYGKAVSVLLNLGDGTFAAAAAYDVGSRSKSVAIGDLDGINGPDLAVAHSDSDGVSVLLNLGDGTFAPVASYDAGDHPSSVAIGDLDGVNGPDLAVANDYGDDVSVLLNLGDGTFAAAVAYDVGSRPMSVAVADLDGINGPDLAVANYHSHDVSVLLNRGRGAFAAAVPYDVGSRPMSVAVADLDGIDGPDLAVANYDSGDVSVLLSRGDGTFAPAVPYDAGTAPFSVAIGDLDGLDGPDLAVVDYSSGGVSVLLQQGDGTFAAPVAYAVGIGPISLAIGDLDGMDGPDLAVVDVVGDVSVRLNPGDGNFELGSGTARDPYCLIQAAINNSVDADQIVVAPGTYLEAINFLGKAIAVRSARGSDVTTISGQSSGRVVTCENGEGPDTVLQGFTITGGLSVIGGGMINRDSSPTIIGCVFTRNTVWFPNGSLGGGMYNLDSDPTLIACTFWANDTGGSFGSAGGGIFNDGSSPTIVNCLFHSNDSDGIHNFNGSSPIIANCTITLNFTTGVSSSFNSYPVITNSIIWNNPYGQIVDSGFKAMTTVNASDVDGGWTGAGSGNIDADPLFVGGSTCCAFDLSRPGCDDPDCEAAVCEYYPFCCSSSWDPYCAYAAALMCTICPNDYRLQRGSPCIDAGNNWGVAGLIETDLDGNPRFMGDGSDIDPGCGEPVVVDMGAYEFPGTPFDVVFGDLDGNGIVGVMDLMILNGCMGSRDPECCIADLDLDGEVGMSDLLLMGGALLDFVPLRAGPS